MRNFWVSGRRHRLWGRKPHTGMARKFDELRCGIGAGLAFDFAALLQEPLEPVTETLKGLYGTRKCTLTKQGFVSWRPSD